MDIFRGGNSYGAKVLLTAIAMFAMPVHAVAWGYEAHRVIAEIAEEFLGTETTRQVRGLLAVDNVTNLADVSIWADQIRLQRPETGPWHYVDIPIHPDPGEYEDYDAERDCPRDECIVGKIEQFERVLADHQASARQRLEALKYLVHFIGDIHQPLHTSNNDDRGGNDVRVTFMGHQTNLHAVWDSGIIAPAIKGDERGYALQLAREITEEKRAIWAQGNPVSWADESHRIAAQVIYGELPNSGTLPDSYEAIALPVVNEQLERAGVRLATVLRALLRSESND